MRSALKKRKIFIIVASLLFILSLNFFKKDVKGFFYSLSEPMQKNLWKKGIVSSDFFEAIFSAKYLQKENESLRARIHELLSENSYLKGLEDENKTLREALELDLQEEFKLELAEIIGKDNNRDAILINKGLESGLAEGSFVITAQKVLIGRIKDAYQNYSRVELISDKESSFEAKISGSSISGLVRGLGGYQAVFDLLPKDKEIKEGDLVVSGGFLIGLVKGIKKIDVDPFQKAEIALFFEISDAVRVFIVLDKR